MPSRLPRFRYTVLLSILLLGASTFSQTKFNVKQIGGSGDDLGSTLAVDSFGNLFVAGNFSGSVDFDPGSGVDLHTSNGSSDIFLCKFDSAGNFLWAKTWGGPAMDRASGIAVDKWNNVYVAGPYQGTVDFDPGPGVDNHTSNAGTMNNPFIAKFDNNGNFRWARTWGGKVGAEAYSCATDKNGNAYAVGDFSETAGVAVDFDPGPGVDNHYCNGAFDAWIVKYDSSGNYVWGRTWGGAGYDDGPSVAVDDGGVYDAGMFASQNCNFAQGVGTDLHSSNGDIDVFINKFDLNGNHIWTRTWGGKGGDDAGKIIADQKGHIYIVGYYADTVDFDPGPGVRTLNSAGGISDVFLSKFDTAGNFIWAKSFGGPGEDKGFGLARDQAENLYLAGYFTSTGNFNPGPGTFNLTSAGGYDVFVSKLDSSGSFIWAKRFGGSGDDIAISCELDASNNLFIVGGFNGTANFDPGAGTYNLTSNGSRDIFIEKFYSAASATSVAGRMTTEPSGFVLEQSYPNPANPVTRIAYVIPAGAASRLQVAGSEKTAGSGWSSAGSYVRLTIYDVLGREIAVLVDGVQAPGRHEVVFDARNLASGVYVYRLTSAAFSTARRLVVLN
jgi:hypothetical protein